jgi:manganese transport protein
MDPGNWATDLAGGAQFGYALLWVLLMSNLMAVLLQTLSARLGVVTGHDLAQACRAEYSRPIGLVLWLLAEIAIAATDLAEVVGTIIALNLLFKIPLLWGCAITALDTFLLLGLQRLGIRKMEAFILALVATIGACFLVQILMAKPDALGMAKGLWPSLPPDENGSSRTALFIAIGILGATVMPHNLYLHSALVQSRKIGRDTKSKALACRYNFIDSAIALNAAFFVNAAILVLAGTTFYFSKTPVDTIERAHELLPQFLGPAAPWLFGIALLCAGQSSTLTGTLAGQIVMEGFLNLRLAPWLRRLITRGIALIPAVLVIWLAGEKSTQDLLLLSQVILSLQLSFAVIPLIHFTSNRRNMGVFASSRWVAGLAWLVAITIVALNLNLVLENVMDWSRAGQHPLLVAGVVALLVAAAMLLLWVTFKPLFRPSAAWVRQEPVMLDWTKALHPVSPATIAIALEHSVADAEILNRALGLARAGQTRLLLLHVADTPMAEVYGADAADRHTQADAMYLDDVVETLCAKGFLAKAALLHGKNPAEQIVAFLKREPADLLVVGSHGHGLLTDLLFGQTVDKVRHGLDIPMMIARPGGLRENPGA